ncbi:MAG: PDZ domain-containing protein [Opitutales bacterium]|nr:PDZ domain-containing protein [Opitutales bacterium]
MLVKKVPPSIMLKNSIRRAGSDRAIGFRFAGIAWVLAACTVLATSAPAVGSFDRLLEAVVRIDVRETSFEGGSSRLVSGVGSGVILSKDGLVLTNAHVVSPQAVDIWITLSSLERVRAELLGWDHWTDLALLRLDMENVKERKLRYSVAKFGRSDSLKPGQTVFAAGTPHGLSRTVTKGIISNKERYYRDSTGIRGYETGFFNTWLQTDAAINPGNSGGPLVDTAGRVIGINTRTYLGADNLGFAIPEKTARQVMQALERQGEVDRSYIGISPGFLQDMEAFYELEANQGLLINSVDPGSPAAVAGIRASDIVLSIDGKHFDGRFPEQIPPIRNLIASYAVGAEISMEMKRGEESFIVQVVTERLESRVGKEWAFEKWGLTVREVSRTFARERQLETDDGVVVIGTQSAFPAEKAGLRRGDVISKINQTELGGLDDLKGYYDAYESLPEALLMETLRNRTVSFKVIKP